MISVSEASLQNIPKEHTAHLCSANWNFEIFSAAAAVETEGEEERRLMSNGSLSLSLCLINDRDAKRLVMIM